MDCDILIVGGGIAGASLGARLARHARVTLIEGEAHCGRHATGRSVAFWQATLGGDTPERRLSIASKAMFDARWPGTDTPLLKPRHTLHLTGECGEDFPDAPNIPAGFAPRRLSRSELEQIVPEVCRAWTGAWLEESSADIDVAALHSACLAEIRRAGGSVRTDVRLSRARPVGGRWQVRTNAGPIEAMTIVNAAGAWGDEVAQNCGVAPLALEPRRRTVVQLRVGRRGIRDLPMVTDVRPTFYFKGEGDNEVWLCPLDETLVDPCDAVPEEIDVAIAVDRFQQVVNWPVEAVTRKWAGLRTFAPDRGMKFGYDPQVEGFFWCVGQGGMGIQTSPAASLLCASLILGEPLPRALAVVDPGDFAPRGPARHS